MHGILPLGDSHAPGSSTSLGARSVAVGLRVAAGSPWMSVLSSSTKGVRYAVSGRRALQVNQGALFFIRGDGQRLAPAVAVWRIASALAASVSDGGALMGA